MKINWNQRIIISQRSTQLCPLLQWNQIISHFAAISCLRVFHFLPDCFLHKNDCHHRIHARQWMTSRLEIIQGHSKLGLAGDCLLTRRFRHWEICAKRYWCLAHRIAHRTALHHTSIWICQKTKWRRRRSNALKEKKRKKGTKVQRYKGTKVQTNRSCWTWILHLKSMHCVPWVPCVIQWGPCPCLAFCHACNVCSHWFPTVSYLFFSFLFLLFFFFYPNWKII